MIGYAIYRLLSIYELLIVVWCVMSWIPKSDGIVGEVRSGLSRVVSPYLDLFRGAIPALGGVDLSPILAVFVLELVARLVLRLL